MLHLGMKRRKAAVQAGILYSHNNQSEKILQTTLYYSEESLLSTVFAANEES